jgi:uncharacterized protein YkwD
MMWWKLLKPNRIGLCSAALLGALAACGPAQPQSEIKFADVGGESQLETSTTTLSDAERRILEETNRVRVQNGLEKFLLNPRCSEMAREQSVDMVVCSYFDHSRPACANRGTGAPQGGESFAERAARHGLTQGGFAENILMGEVTPEQTVELWMKSEGHRANILNPNFRSIGIGVAGVDGGRGPAFTQCFSSLLL